MNIKSKLLNIFQGGGGGKFKIIKLVRSFYVHTPLIIKSIKNISIFIAQKIVLVPKVL